MPRPTMPAPTTVAAKAVHASAAPTPVEVTHTVVSRARASTAVGVRLTTTVRTGGMLAVSDAQDGEARWPEGERRQQHQRRGAY